MNSVERVKALCKAKKIPLYKLEKDLGFANGYIGQLRKGTLPADRLEKIAEYLEVSSAYLLTGEDQDGYYINPETAAIAQEIFEDKDRRLLFDASRNLTPEQIRLLYSMALSWQSEDGE